VSWQVVVLPLLAAGAVAGGILIGRQGSDSRSGAADDTDMAAAEVAGAAAAGQDAAPVIDPPTGGQPAAVAGAAEAMPGVAAGEIVQMPDSIHVLKGQPAPRLAMTQLGTGETVDLADLKGRPVLINFWSTWCAPCRLEMPWIQSVYDEYKDDGLEVLSIDSGEKVPPSLIEDHIQRFVTSMGMTFPVLYGDNTYDVQDTWTVVGLPVTFLVDREGTVVDVHSGAYPNRATLADQVSRLLMAEAAQ
jgi:thiol-disulfide isomerase/thioredoxin